MVPTTRRSAASRSATESFSFLTSRSRLDVIAATPRNTAASAMSTMVTSSPDIAQACAMPLPMVPAPMTPMEEGVCIDGLWKGNEGTSHYAARNPRSPAARRAGRPGTLPATGAHATRARSPGRPRLQPGIRVAVTSPVTVAQ